MTNKPQIDEPACAVKTLADASNALERAEFIDCDPALQPDPRSHPFMAWIRIKKHPDAKAYREAVIAQHYPNDEDVPAARHSAVVLSKHPHKQRRELRKLLNSLKAAFDARLDARVNDTFQGGIRRLIDADLRRDFVRADLHTVERAIRAKHEARRDAKLKEQQKRRQQLRSMGLMS
jgi:hypothetical protein